MKKLWTASIFFINWRMALGQFMKHFVLEGNRDPFYEDFGYEVVTEEFLDAGIPHKTMIKKR
jgi:predicted GNAT family N-acyltransferase